MRRASSALRAGPPGAAKGLRGSRTRRSTHRISAHASGKSAVIEPQQGLQRRGVRLAPAQHAWHAAALPTCTAAPSLARPASSPARRCTPHLSRRGREFAAPYVTALGPRARRCSAAPPFARADARPLRRRTSLDARLRSPSAAPHRPPLGVGARRRGYAKRFGSFEPTALIALNMPMFAMIFSFGPSST